MKPYYKHDCEDCNYLGSVILNLPTRPEVKADLYSCVTDYVARMSDEPCDYLASHKSIGGNVLINFCEAIEKYNGIKKGL